jgi:nitrogen fixation/metabolism regulation signal transduction histidine kinase
MSKSQELDAKTLHDVLQPLNIIRLSCGNIRARMGGYATDDAEYLITKLMRIEEQVVRATELLQDLKRQYADDTSVEDV